MKSLLLKAFRFSVMGNSENESSDSDQPSAMDMVRRTIVVRAPSQIADAEANRTGPSEGETHTPPKLSNIPETLNIEEESEETIGELLPR